jgi:hypothetical protein
MYRIIIICLVLLPVTFAFSQNQEVEKLKKENSKLEKQNSTLKSENSTLKNENLVLQNEKSALKQDTAYLIKKNTFCTQILSYKDFKIEHTFNNYNIQLISCKGDRAKQSMTIEILMTNNNVNHYVNYSDYKKLFAIDILGNKYSNISIGDSDKKWIQYGEKTIFPTNVPIKVNITIGNVLPSLEVFKIINIGLFYKTEGSANAVNCEIVFRDIKINW